MKTHTAYNESGYVEKMANTAHFGSRAMFHLAGAPCGLRPPTFYGASAPPTKGASYGVNI